MTAKEFVKAKYPDAECEKTRIYSVSCYVVYETGSKKLSAAKTEDRAWSLAKKLILENDKMKKYDS